MQRRAISRLEGGAGERMVDQTKPRILTSKGRRLELSRRRLARIRRLTVSVGLLALLAAPMVKAADWPMYLGDLTHSGFAAGESTINAQTAPSLGLKWSVSAPGVVSAQPTVAGGRVYWGSWDGYERATGIDGSPLWSTNLGTTTVPPDPGCDQVTYGVVSSATVATIGRGATVFVGGGDGQLYALDAESGSVVWTTRLGPSPDSLVWSSPVYYDGSIFV